LSHSHVLIDLFLFYSRNCYSCGNPTCCSAVHPRVAFHDQAWLNPSKWPAKKELLRGGRNKSTARGGGSFSRDGDAPNPKRALAVLSRTGSSVNTRSSVSLVFSSSRSPIATILHIATFSMINVVYVARGRERGASKGGVFRLTELVVCPNIWSVIVCIAFLLLCFDQHE
jgi:hypothetical protein